MQADVKITPTRKQLKATARKTLSNQGTLLKLIFGGALYIAVLVLLELFTDYAFIGLFFDTSDAEADKYYAIFYTVSAIPKFLLSAPLFLGLKRLAAILSNGECAEFIEIFAYYGSFKKLTRAWGAAAVVQAPFILISAAQRINPLFLSGNILLLLNFILSAAFFLAAVFVPGRLFPFLNSVVCGGTQSVSRCFKASAKATRGKILMLFAFYLSFIPWILLSLLTVGTLFIIFTFPYMLVSECLYSSYLLTDEYRTNTTEETI